MTDVAGKTAFVTGGASGLGLATARALADRGARLILADIDGAGAEAAAESLRAAGAEAMGLQLDVTDEASWADAGAAAQAFGPVRILFSNAAWAAVRARSRIMTPTSGAGTMPSTPMRIFMPAAPSSVR